jgi:hypothetical protein
MGAKRLSASDVSDLQACNQCLRVVWVRSQLTALDMFHRIKEIFGVEYIPVVSSVTPVSSTIKIEKSR